MNAIVWIRRVIFLAVLFVPVSARAATWYVAPTGSDTAAGTMAAPFASWARAQTAAAAGDTVYFRGGTYAFTDATTTCTSGTATVNAVVLNKSGTSGNPIRYWAFPGEKPLFDFSGINDPTKYSCRQVGVRIQADWLYLKGMELKGTLQLNNLNHESWCVYVIGGNNNIFEQMDAHHNMGPGFFIQAGGHNTFLNCDSHENEDTLTSNGDGQSADGFGCHPNQAGDTGNIFIGCRAWWNSDDAWDFINSQEVCTVQYSWAWYSGYKPDAIMNGAPVALAAGNGNGFKGGGYGDNPQTGVPAVPPQHVIEQNCAFYNKANGLYANHEIINPFFYNNTSFNNGTDVDMLGLDGTTVTSVGFLRNNLAYSNDGHATTADLGNGGPISDMFNSWDMTTLKIVDADFQSVAFAPPASCPEAYTPGGTACCAPTDMTCFAGMASQRNADGSLPVLPFLRLSTTLAKNPLVDVGTPVGLPFTGAAPDLGCFETGEVFDPSPDGGTTTGGSSSSSSGGGSSSGSSSGGAADAGGGGAVDAGGGRQDAGTAVDASVGAGSSSGGSGGSSGATTSSSGSSSGTTTGNGSGSSSGVTGGSSTGSSGGNGASPADGGTAPGETRAGCGCVLVGLRHSPAGAPLAGVGLLLAALGAGRRRKGSRAKARD